MATLFVSHSSRDGAAIAQPLAAALEAAGHRCWIAPRDVTPGRPYPGQIVAAIRNCDGLILIVTPAANESPDVLQEVQLANQGRKTVAPVIVDGATLSDDLHYYLGVRHQIPWSDPQKTTTELLRSFPAPAAAAPAHEESPDTSPDEPAFFGDIYLAKVTQIDQRWQIAQVDYGGAQPGHLHLNHLHPDYFQLSVDQRNALLVGQRTWTGDRYTIRQDAFEIQDVLKPRQILLVQITGEDMGNGPGLSTYIALTGDYCQLLPTVSHAVSTSNDIPDANRRALLQAIAEEYDLPQGMSLFVHAAPPRDDAMMMHDDIAALLEKWEQIRSQTLASNAPSLIHQEAAARIAPDPEEDPDAAPGADEDQQSFDVVMLSPNGRVIDAIKILREYSDLSLADAKTLVQSHPPVRLGRGLTYLSAYAFTRQLRENGVTMLDPVKST